MQKERLRYCVSQGQECPDYRDINSSQGNLQMAKLLLNTGIDVNAKNIDGSIVLLEASRVSKLEVVAYLLAAKTDMNPTLLGNSQHITQLSDKSESPLHYYYLNAAQIRTLSILLALHRQSRRPSKKAYPW